jgi:hypothetical protein
MSVVELIALLQSGNGQAQTTSNPPSALYIVLVLAAAVLALIVLVFIRTTMQRSRKGANHDPKRSIVH